MGQNNSHEDAHMDVGPSNQRRDARSSGTSQSSNTLNSQSRPIAVPNANASSSSSSSNHTSNTAHTITNTTNQTGQSQYYPNNGSPAQHGVFLQPFGAANNSNNTMASSAPQAIGRGLPPPPQLHNNSSEENYNSTHINHLTRDDSGNDFAMSIADRPLSSTPQQHVLVGTPTNTNTNLINTSNSPYLTNNSTSGNTTNNTSLNNNPSNSSSNPVSSSSSSASSSTSSSSSTASSAGPSTLTDRVRDLLDPSAGVSTPTSAQSSQQLQSQISAQQTNMNLNPSANAGNMTNPTSDMTDVAGIQNPPPLPAKLETVPTAFRWVHGGNEVFVTGSFNNWQGKIHMYASNEGEGEYEEFTLLIDIPPGTHHYKYIVDQEWRLDPDAPVVQVGGVWNNVIEVKRPVFEYTPASFADSDEEEVDERKQKALYRQRAPLPSDYVNDPPRLPPHFSSPSLVLNDFSLIDPLMLSVPNHVTLNHLHIMHQGCSDQSVLVTGITQRFKPSPHTKITHKFVTTVYYAPKSLYLGTMDRAPPGTTTINTPSTNPIIGTPTGVRNSPLLNQLNSQPSPYMNPIMTHLPPTQLRLSPSSSQHVHVPNMSPTSSFPNTMIVGTPPSSVSTPNTQPFDPNMMHMQYNVQAQPRR